VKPAISQKKSLNYFLEWRAFMNKIIDDLKIKGYQKKVIIIPLKRNNSKNIVQLEILIDDESNI
jgi:hypothetical protein